MAKYYSSTFGAISGKHGSAVAVLRKDGTTYLRLYVKSSNPRTDKQQAHRAKFALSSKALVPFNPIFKKTIGVTNGISTARSHAFKNAIVGEYPNFSVDYEKIMFSFGSLENIQCPSVSVNDGVMSVKWQFDNILDSLGEDSVSFVFYNKDTNQAVHLEDVATRADMEAKIEVHEAWAESDLLLWVYVTSGDEISNSVFVNQIAESIDVEDSIDEDTCSVDNEVEHLDVAVHGSGGTSLRTDIRCCCTVDYFGNMMCEAYRSLKILLYFILNLAGFVPPTYIAGVLKLNFSIENGGVIKGLVNYLSLKHRGYLLNLQYRKFTFAPLKL